MRRDTNVLRTKRHQGQLDGRFNSYRKTVKLLCFRSSRCADTTLNITLIVMSLLKSKKSKISKYEEVKYSIFLNVYMAKVEKDKGLIS